MVHDCKCSFIDHSRHLIYAKRLDIIKRFEEILVFIAGGEGGKGEFQWGSDGFLCGETDTGSVVA